MYQSFINYDEEFFYYDKILKNHSASCILEIGCGSGNMAKRLLNAGYEYCGIDISEQMLAIAREQLPQTDLICADMRNFSSVKKFDAALIAGRSLSYILSAEDLMRTFYCVHGALHTGGYFIFDIIDAGKFMPSVNSSKTILHSMKHNDTEYMRESVFEVNEKNKASCWNWHATYFMQHPGEERKEIAKDFTTLRSFYKTEIENALSECGFAIAEINERPSYAFDTLVFTAVRLR